MKFRNLFNFGNKRERVEQAVQNIFNESFLAPMNNAFTLYDSNAKTYIEKAYNINPIVYSVINQQATKTASIPYYIRKIKDKANYQKLEMMNIATKSDLSPQQMIKRMRLEVKAFENEDIEFPMERPNVNQTWYEFFALYKTFLKTTGNVYIYILSPELGQEAGVPIQVYILPSQYMQIITKNPVNLDNTENPITGYMLTYGRTYRIFEEKDVIHIKYPNPNFGENGEHLYGMSPLRAGLKNIQSTNKGLDLNIKTLQNGGAFGFIHAKNTALTESQAKQIKDRLLEMNASPDDLSKIAGISAEIAFTRLSLTSDELKPFDYFKFDQKQICNILSWDDKLLNSDDGAKYDNVDIARRRVISDNIVPDLKLLEEAFNSKFLPRFKGYENTILVFDVTELPEMQIDMKQLSEWLNGALDRGVITRAEYRAALNYAKVDDPNLDKFTVATDILTLDEALDDTFKLTE